MTEASSAFEKAVMDFWKALYAFGRSARDSSKLNRISTRKQADKAHKALLAQRAADIAAAVTDRDARIKALEEALRPFGKAADAFNAHAHDDSWTIAERMGKPLLRLEHLRRARAVIEEEQA